jgi:hypothetical protein
MEVPAGKESRGASWYCTHFGLGTLPSLFLDRFLVYGETSTSLVNASPILRRAPPIDGDE